MRLSEKKQRLSPLCLRFTFEERAALEQVSSGMSLSAYIRFRLFGDDVMPRRRMRNKPPIEDQQALARIFGMLGQSRISNNLKQLAKAVNMGVLVITPETEADIKEACRYVRHMRFMLMNALGLKPRGRS